MSNMYPVSGRRKLKDSYPHGLEHHKGWNIPISSANCKMYDTSKKSNNALLILWGVHNFDFFLQNLPKEINIYLERPFDRKSIEIWFNHLQEMTKEVGACLTGQMQKTFGFYWLFFRKETVRTIYNLLHISSMRLFWHAKFSKTCKFKTVQQTSVSQNFDTPKKIVYSCWKPKGLQSWVVISVISGRYLQKCVRQSLLFGS